MKDIALILARGGSKGIPNKNIRILNGLPLIAYSIIEAQKVVGEHVYVSTDSKDIGEVAAMYCARVVTRPAELATDTCKSEPSLLHFSSIFDFKNMIFIQPTSPLIKAEYIFEGLKMMSEYDSVFSAYKEHWIPRWNENCKPIDYDISNRPRRQDKPFTYVENGAFYITSKELLINSGLRYSGNIGIVEMPQLESFQVDSYDDLNIIEAILKSREK